MNGAGAQSGSRNLRLCRSCHQMRAAELFCWSDEKQAYCSEICLQRMRIPKPRRSPE